MVAKQAGSSVYYYFKDALGSTRQVWKQGTPKAAFSVATYAPFGAPVGASGTEAFEYAGEMLVDAAGPAPGMYYVYARWMDPELGRFVSLDPLLGSLSSPQTMNRYAYCVNNPLRFVDPTGTKPWFDLDLDGVDWSEVAYYALGCPLIYDFYRDIRNEDWAMVGLDIVSLYPGTKGARGGGKLVSSLWRLFGKADDSARFADDITRLGGKADDVSRLGGKADDIVTVRHYTSAENRILIETSGVLRGGKTWVTLPSEIPGGFGKSRFGQRIIEDRLGILAGKGEWFIDVQVRRNLLGEIPGHPRTSGHALQWILKEDVPIGRSGFLPWFAW